MSRGAQKNVTYEFILAPLTVSRMSYLSYLDDFRVAVQLLFYRCCFKIDCSILVQFQSSFFSMHFVAFK